MQKLLHTIHISFISDQIHNILTLFEIPVNEFHKIAGENLVHDLRYEERE